jgi:RHS repeat-associated protein
MTRVAHIQPNEATGGKPPEAGHFHHFQLLQRSVFGVQCSVFSHIHHSDPEPNWYIYHSDHLGSSAFLTDASGDPTQHLQYMPFGETFVEQRSVTSYYTPYTFSAKERDLETGYSYFGARYYDADISVWLSVDPMADKAPGWTPYHYVKHNTINRFDPFGLTDYLVEGERKTISDGHSDVTISVTQRQFKKLERKFNKGKTETYATLRDRYSKENGFTTITSEDYQDDQGNVIMALYKKDHKPGQYTYSEWYNKEQSKNGLWGQIHVRSNIPLIDGPRNNSWENLGAWLREIGSNLDGWRNGGKTPEALQIIADINPLVSLANSRSYFLEGNDIHGNESICPTVSGVYNLLGVRSSFINMTYRSVSRDFIVNKSLTSTRR